MGLKNLLHGRREGCGRLDDAFPRPLALGRAGRIHLHHAQQRVGPRVLRANGQSLAQDRLGHCKARGPILGENVNADCHINFCRADQRLNILGIERQGAFEKAARLRQVFVSYPLI